MDTAFRRRWNMTYVGIDTESAPATLVPIEREAYVPWSELMKAINQRIVEHTNTDDKQVGPWFVRAADADQVNPLEFASKVLFYLWSDVFRDAPEKLFRDHLQTYDQLVRDYLARKPVFREEIVKELSATPPEGERSSAAATPQDSSAS